MKLTYLQIFRFWFPLAATWLMMAVELPFVAAVIARLPEPKINLAAYGVAFSLALIIEAPVIMILSASVALVTHRTAFLKLRRFIYSLIGIVSFLLVVGLVPSIFRLITEGLFDLPENVARLTHNACLILLPWPAAIGYRRFYQGILIRQNLTRRVAIGTGIRLCAMIAAGMIMSQLEITGVYVGVLALVTGVICEAVASRLMAHKSVNALLTSASDSIDSANTSDTTDTSGELADTPITYRYITKFYYPLALTAILTLGIHPITIFFIGNSRFAIESLAVLPVILSFVFIFGSIGMSFQEVGVALLGVRNQRYIPLRNFAVFLSLAIFVCLALIAFTPFAGLWYQHVSGLSTELTRFAYLPTQIFVLQPAMTVWNSFLRSILICGKLTGPITWATVAEVALIIFVLSVFISVLGHNGAIATAAAYIVGKTGANLYMIPPCYRVLRKFD